MILFALPLLLASPAFAQQQDSDSPIINLPRGNTQSAPDNRQGPELDVFRDPVTPAVTPPPVVVLPPVVTPTAPQPAAQTPAPRRETPPPQSATERNVTQPTQRSERPEAEAAAPSESESTADEAPATPAPVPAPTERGDAANANPAEPDPMAEASGEALPWPWIAGGVALLLAAVAFFFLRRRRAEPEEDEYEEKVALASVEPIAAEPVVAETSAPPLSPSPEAVAPTPAAPVPASATTARAQIDLSLEVTGARNSLMGLTVGYVLTLSNRGEQVAQDLLVRGLIGNAGGDQQALLQQFMDGQTGWPLHSAVAIAPGASQRLTGELRLTADQITPVPMGQRLLLIPLAAFDVRYCWGEDSADPAGTGRTGGAFIIGQEQEPPAERLAPFRLDLGPRQYRRPGARVARQFAGN